MILDKIISLDGDAMVASSSKIEITQAEEPIYEKITDFATENDLFKNSGDPGGFRQLLSILYGYSYKSSMRGIHFVVHLNGRLVGHYGGSYRLIKTPSGPCRSSLASNLVIKSGVNIPLFYVIQKHFRQACKEAGYDCAYAILTNPRLIGPHLRVGWVLCNEAYVHVRPLQIDRFLIRSLPKVLALIIGKPFWACQRIFNLIFRKRQGSHTVSTFEEFDATFDDLLVCWRSRRSVVSFRSIEELNWRFQAIAGRRYIKLCVVDGGVVQGYLVARLMNMKGVRAMAIVDFVSRDDGASVPNQLLSKIVAIAQNESAELLAVLMHPDSTDRRYFTKFGFFRSPFKFFFLARSVGRADAASLLKADGGFSFTWYEHDFI